MKSKALPITKALCLVYEQLFMFDNATYYTVYEKNLL